MAASLTKRYPLNMIIILAGILFSLYLVGQIPDEVFFSGDAGVKALLTKQFSEGNFRVDLDLQAESWVKMLWKEGFFPIEPPFIYNINDRYYIQYPFLFSLLNAPFYKLLGYQGLYVIPLISAWILWFVFYRVCQNLKLGKAKTSIALIILIFASPLTMYSAMFWEHILAVSLAFCGVAIFLKLTTGDVSSLELVVGGILLGLSVWFRPELLCLVFIILLLMSLSQKLNLKELDLPLFKKITFICSVIITVLLFFGLNQFVYHHPLGVHAFQVIGNEPINHSVTSTVSSLPVNKPNLYLIKRTTHALLTFLRSNAFLFYTFPIFLFLVLANLALFLKKIKLNSTTKLLLLIGIAFDLLVILILPDPNINQWSDPGGKQWGPRFLLVLVPLISLLVVIELKFIVKYLKKFKLGNIFLLFLILSLYQNTYRATVKISKDYHERVFPALEFLRQNDNQVVAFSHQYASQDLEAIFEKKIVFLAKNSQQLEQLGKALLKERYQEFIYVRFPFAPNLDLHNVNFISNKQRFKIQFSDLGKFGLYRLYRASILEL